MTTSACATAAGTSATLRPEFSAFFQEVEPARKPTVTSTPESLRLSACA